MFPYVCELFLFLFLRTVDSFISAHFSLGCFLLFTCTVLHTL